MEAERKAKQKAKNAKAKMAQDMAMIGRFRKQGASETQIRAFMGAGEDG